MDTINTSSLLFDAFAAPFSATDSTYSTDFSPISLFNPLEDFGAADLTSDSAGSPSPVSPGLAASPFGFSTTDEWTHWDSIEHSPEPDALFKSEPFGNPLLSSMPAKRGMTPAINPMALTMPTADPFPYEAQALRNQLPLFRQQPQVNLARVSAPTVPSSTVQTRQDDVSAQRYPSRSLKRKSSSPPSEDDEPSTPPHSVATRRGSADKGAAAPKKTAHNMIEKRYRTNLNHKIAQLRDAVPALRVVVQRVESGPDEQGENAGFLNDEVSGLVPVAKLNKATILSKATEYIAQLERRNRNLEIENSALRGRMEGLEMLLMGRQPQAPADVWS
ncbi:hypothetical protein B0T18DRAFT_20726 [Schizothecium vesticola]|uniref:BHLH domain-containing protein n=1 Tax=Schizothecium vesticola TaxID=314040 RepID=A0AA40F9T9_9PEZI|nr:hypothetical protein B0T18DRAFT_20726 [Schizothecium vesticola]